MLILRLHPLNAFIRWRLVLLIIWHVFEDPYFAACLNHRFLKSFHFFLSIWFRCKVSEAVFVVDQFLCLLLIFVDRLVMDLLLNSFSQDLRSLRCILNCIWNNLQRIRGQWHPDLVRWSTIHKRVYNRRGFHVEVIRCRQFEVILQVVNRQLLRPLVDLARVILLLQLTPRSSHQMNAVFLVLIMKAVFADNCCRRCGLLGVDEILNLLI